MPSPPPPCLPPLPQWATFPLLQLAFQVGDWKALLDNRTVGATLHGANNTERLTGEPRTDRDAPAGWLHAIVCQLGSKPLHCCL